MSDMIDKEIVAGYKAERRYKVALFPSFFIPLIIISPAISNWLGSQEANSFDRFEFSHGENEISLLGTRVAYKGEIITFISGETPQVEQIVFENKEELEEMPDTLTYFGEAISIGAGIETIKDREVIMSDNLPINYTTHPHRELIYTDIIQNEEYMYELLTKIETETIPETLISSSGEEARVEMERSARFEIVANPRSQDQLEEVRVPIENDELGAVILTDTLGIAIASIASFITWVGIAGFFNSKTPKDPPTKEEYQAAKRRLKKQ